MLTYLPPFSPFLLALLYYCNVPDLSILTCEVKQKDKLTKQKLDPVETSFADLIFRDIHLIGSFMASQAETQQMLYDIVEHKIKVENNVFHGLEEIPRAVEMLRNGQYRGKACIVVDEDEFEKDQENKRV